MTLMPGSILGQMRLVVIITTCQGSLMPLVISLSSYGKAPPKSDARQQSVPTVQSSPDTVNHPYTLYASTPHQETSSPTTQSLLLKSSPPTLGSISIGEILVGGRRRASAKE